MRLPGSSPAFIGLPHHSNGSTYHFYPRTRFSTGRLSGLQLFLDVQASQFARLPDRSYRCKFPHRAAEASTSEQNVRRCLRTHRTCYPPDYRQLAERGLSPRKTRSLVGCSVGIELRRACCRWRVTSLALSIARWDLISTMATVPEAPL